jgi:predicted DNA-binding transcriptional regulator YafY
VERVLPERVRARVRAVEEMLAWDVGAPADGGPDAAVVLTLGMAARERRRVALRYRRADGEATERRFDPYGLVCRRGRWYGIGHCHLRGGLRLFRLDRVAAVRDALGSVPRRLSVEVALDTTIEDARRRVSADVATLEAEASGYVVLRGYTDNPDWLARLLANLGCRLEIRRPPELRDALRRHAAEIARWADAEPENPD